MIITIVKDPVPDFTGDYYAVLGVTPVETHQGITRAYRRLIMKYHPDRLVAGIPNPDMLLKYRLIQKAYDVLSNPESRTFYNDTGTEKMEDVLVESNASKKLTDRIVDVCNNLCSDTNTMTPEQLAKFDVMNHVRSSLAQECMANHRGQAGMEKVVAKLQVVLKRMHKKNTALKNTAVGLVLGQQLRDVRRTIGQARNDLAILRRAEELAIEYEYEVEPTPPPVSTVIWTNASNPMNFTRTTF